MAAVALHNGVKDPLWALKLSEDDRMVMTVVIEKADGMRKKELGELAEAIGLHCGNEVARVLAKAFG